MSTPSLKPDLALAAIATIALAASAWAAQPGTNHAAPYAGQHTRAVSSLSATDIDDLLAGRGWGLAKPAEFNGYPGPAHILELADQLGISPEQRARIQKSFDAMQARAVETGARYVEAERAIDTAFKDGRAHQELATRLADAERLRADLRRIHLAAHLEVTPILTDAQRDTYQRLRGYRDAGTANQGHNAGGHGAGAHKH